MSHQHSSANTARIECSEICALIVTYFPKPSSAQTLAKVASRVEHLLIVDNGSPVHLLAPIAEAASEVGATVLRIGNNVGIAKAQNLALEFAKERGYRWLATFDQDSEISESMFDEMVRIFASHPAPHRIGIISPVHVDKKMQVVVRDTTHREDSCPWRAICTTMSSGNLVNVDIAMQVGGYDDSLFIDYVDHEFCLRLRKNGYLVLEAKGAELLHALGTMERRRFGPWHVVITNHSAIRHYYMSRNRLIVWCRYGWTEPAWVLRDMRRFPYEVVRMVAYEADVPKKLRMILRGIVDAIRGVRGALSPR